MKLNFPATDNEAEYEALIVGLDLAGILRVKNLKVCGDSKLVVSQVKGEFEARNEIMARYVRLVRAVMTQFDECHVEHIPRGENVKVYRAMFTYSPDGCLLQGHQKVKKATIQTLKAEFESLSIQDSEQLEDFSMKLNGLVTNIRALGEEIQASNVVKKLLHAVPSRFLQIPSTLEQFGDLETMTVEEATGSLRAHEERMKGK
ncbi:hypothetical protein AgCh_025888 [Apium graveolens]